METNPLKAERKRRGWSQIKIAEALGVSSKTVSRWELGLAVPYPYYREQLCALFGKDARELGLLSDIDEHDVGKPAPLVGSGLYGKDDSGSHESLNPDQNSDSVEVLGASGHSYYPLVQFTTPKLSQEASDQSVDTPVGRSDTLDLSDCTLPQLSPPQLKDTPVAGDEKTPSPIKKARIVLLALILLCLIVAGSQALVPVASYTNPVLNAPFPDPDVIFAHGRYYAYATGNYESNRLHLQVSSSSDLVHWTPSIEALPMLPNWASSDTTTAWAPSVIQLGRTYTMYYTVPYPQQHNVQCIGVATSMSPAGPFSDTSRSPLTCQDHDVAPPIPCETHPSEPTPDLGGTVDPAPFVDGGKLYLYYKNDGNRFGCPTAIWGQQLSPNGRSFAPGSQAMSLLTNNPFSWEGSIVFAPFMFLHDGQYYLFFSGNRNGWSNETEGYALCSRPLGPCTPAPENPILHGMQKQVIGPGSASLIQIGTQTWMVYHSWVTVINLDGSQSSIRAMNIDRVTWIDGKPGIVPTTTRQAVPQVEEKA